MSLPSLERISDSELHSQLQVLRGQENRIVAAVILHLHEIDKRGIYRDAGYSSLFTYCRERLGYSEGSAYRRVQVARQLDSSPEIYEMIREGKITLSSAAEISKVITAENKDEVLTASVGSSKRESEQIAVRFGAPVKPKRDSIRPKLVAASLEKFKANTTAMNSIEERFAFSFEVGKEAKELFEEAKAIIGHVSVGEIFEKALKEFVQKRRPKPKPKPKPKPEPKPKPAAVAGKEKKPSERVGKGRYVTRSIRRAVVARDGGQCTYCSTDGHRCTERCGLEFDHVVPFAFGGEGTAENLRLLCPAHNQLLAEQSFGRKFMIQRRSS